MGQMSVQYTPVQVLQAARRAEAEGKMDYALQFYRHLVEHHGMTAEAQEAREGLFRIAEWRWGEARVTSTRRQEVANGQSSHASYAASAQQRLSARAALASAAGHRARGREGRRRGVPRSPSRRAIAAPRSSRCWSAAWAGRPCSPASLIAVLAAGGVVADVSAGGLLGLPVGVLLGVPAAVIGLVLIVTGQLATAVFESTNATLELLGQGQGRANA